MRRRRRLELAFVLGLAVLAGVTCTEEFPFEPVDGPFQVEIVPLDWPDTLRLGEETTLRVRVVERQHRDTIVDVPVVWELPDGAPLRLDADTGALEVGAAAVAPGTAQPVVRLPESERFEAAEATVDVGVVAAGVRVGSPAGDTTLVALADTALLRARGLDIDGEGVADTGIEWASGGDAAIELLAATGDSVFIVSRAEGVDTIVASVAQCAGECVDTLVVTVDQRVDSLEVSPPSATINAIGDTLALDVGAWDGKGNAVGSAGLTWTSSDAGVVTVDDAGGVVSQGVGDARVAVAADDVADTVDVQVRQVVAAVVVTPAIDTLLVGDTVPFAAAAVDSNDVAVPDVAIAWSSTDPAVASVDAGGTVVGEAQGAAMIVAASDDGAADTADVAVVESGRIEMEMADSPAEYIDQAWVYISGVFVPDSAVPGRRREIFPRDTALDLATLADGTTAALGAARVPAATYTSVSIGLDSAVVVLRSGFTFDGGATRRRLDFTDADGDVGARITDGAALAADDTLRLLVDFDLNRTFEFTKEPPPTGGSVGDVSWSPRVRAVDEPAAGSIAGRITHNDTLRIEGVLVRALRTDAAGDTAAIHAGADSSFVVRYLPAGGYDVSIPRIPDCYYAVPRSVTVTAGAQTTGVTLDVAVANVASVAVTPPADTLNAIGDLLALAVDAYDAGGTAIPGLRFDWRSLDTGIATVDETGEVTSVATGTARIVATTCGVADTATVHVRQVAATVDIAEDGITIAEGETRQLTATAADSNGVAIDGASFTWSSSDIDYAEVDATGLVTAVAAGNAWIRATLGPAADSALVRVALAPGEVTQALSAAFGVTCGLAVAGDAYCWGTGASGQLGHGLNENATTPVAVSGGYTFKAIDNSSDFGCGLTTGGDAYCWGANYFGQLGDGSTVWTNSPVAVAGGHLFERITVGGAHACGLTGAGAAYCWGGNDDGQLGTGGTSESHTPIGVTGGLTFDALVAGEDHTCGTATDGTTYCWGANEQGQLGRGTTSDYEATPAAVGYAGSTLIALAAGSQHSCGLTADGGAYCWGDANQGQLGNGIFNDNSPSPVAVAGGFTFTRLAAGAWHTCALDGASAAYCWGQGDRGRLGNAQTGSKSAPTAVSGGHAFATIAAGADHTCGITTSGDAYCWGAKERGQLGNDSTAYALTPLAVAAPTTFQTVRTGEQHTCALAAGGDAYCWGNNDSFQLGTGTTAPSNVPVAQGGPAFGQVSMGAYHGCGLDANGKAYCWGSNGAGQLGLGNNQFTSTPDSVAGGHRFQAISAGNEHTCGVTTDGVALCWGLNDHGQLGTGGSTTNSPDTVAGGYSFTTIAASWRHSCAVRTDGLIYCWGDNGQHQLGDGTSNPSTVPVSVQSAETFQAVAAGRTWSSAHNCALTTDARIFCWGEGGSGQLANGGTTRNPTPGQVSYGTGFDAVTAGENHTCAIDDTGAGVCWGASWEGQRGDGTTQTATAPVAIQGGRTFTTLSAGSYYTCGTTAAGTTLCWGSNQAGKLGIGYWDYIDTPITVYGGIQFVH